MTGATSKSIRLVALIAFATAVVVTAAAGPAGAASGRTRFKFADPSTTVVAGTSRFITYGSQVNDLDSCGGTIGALVDRHVPYAIHPDLGMTGICAGGDALPGGPGAWADPSLDVWAPGVYHYRGTYLMFYVATRKGSADPRNPLGQRCIGLATSPSASGPFAPRPTVWRCPQTPAGHWALDPSIFEDSGHLYVTYRDDSLGSGPKRSALAVVQVDRAGRANWSTRRTLLDSGRVPWSNAAADPARVWTIENPSVARIGNGRVYLLFSGNYFDSPAYSTGIADCGTNVTRSVYPCTLQGSSTRPYFGYSSSGLRPLDTLPGDFAGPGGMSAYRTGATSGSLRVVWAVDGGCCGLRTSVNGTLHYSATHKPQPFWVS